MKKMLFLAITLFLAGGVLYAQTQPMSKKEQRAADRAARKAQREAQKRAAAIHDQLLFEAAVDALKNKSFVLEVDRLEFKRGRMMNVQSNTNFISVDNDRAVIQVAFPFGISGPNGIGGITVEGVPSGVEMSTDKDGTVRLKMMVQGVAVSARVDLLVYPGSNSAVATIFPNFNSNRLTVSGYLYPVGEAHIFKGRSL